MIVPEHGPEAIPGLRARIDKTFRVRLGTRARSGAWNSAWDQHRITAHYESMSNSEVYELAPFSGLILNPPPDKQFSLMVDYKQRLDRAITVKGMNEWGNNLIDHAISTLYPAKRYL